MINRRNFLALVAAAFLSACGNVSSSDSATQSDDICSAFSTSVRVGTSDFGIFSKDCESNNAIWSFEYFDGESPEEIIFAISAKDFPEHKDFLNRKIARWAITGLKRNDEKFLNSTAVPLYKKGDQASIEQAKQLFVEYLLSQSAPTTPPNPRS